MTLSRRLAFRLLFPIISFSIVFVAATLWFVIYVTARFIDQQVENTLRWQAYAIHQMADTSIDELQRSGRNSDPSAQLERRINTLMAIEDFARNNQLGIALLNLSTQKITEIGDLPSSLPIKLESTDHVQEFHIENHRYFAYTFSFDPWKWQITLIQNKNTRGPIMDLAQGALVAAAILILGTILFMFYLSVVTQRPITHIIRDLKSGRTPHYEGIVEFEYLSTSIADMMATLQEQSAILERYRDHLEHLVQERTTELTQANQKLQTMNRKLEDTHLQLLESEKLASIGQLAASVAHEISNPLVAVNSNMNTMDNYIKSLMHVIAHYENHHPLLAPHAQIDIDKVKQSVNLNYIQRDITPLLTESKHELDRVKKIVRALKEFSDITDTEWQTINLNSEIDKILNILSTEIEPRIHLTRHYGTLPPLECLPSELNRVIVNMLINAYQAIHNKGTIAIQTSCHAQEVRITISDTGWGIAPEHLPHIFNPFFTTKPLGKNIGLGLSLSYIIVQKHHGRIEVQSELGHGSTFSILLPATQPKKQS